jgi:hypothetical protein
VTDHIDIVCFARDEAHVCLAFKGREEWFTIHRSPQGPYVLVSGKPYRVGMVQCYPIIPCFNR